MSNQDQQPQSRSEAFGEGSQGGPAANTMNVQQSDPMFKPNSIDALANIRSANGLGSTDADRRLYGTPNTLLPTGNGMSAQTRKTGQPLLSSMLNI